MNRWEKITAYVQRDERTGAILRLEEVMPYQYKVEREKRLREALKERIQKMRKIGD